MFAVVDIAGFQEKVSEGDKLHVPTLSKDEGAKVTIDTVLLVSKDGKTSIGTPTVSGAKVELKVLSHGKDPKIVVRKMKRRKRYRRTYGHRQGFTEVEVTKITAGAAKAAAKKEKDVEVEG